MKTMFALVCASLITSAARADYCAELSQFQIDPAYVAALKKRLSSLTYDSSGNIARCTPDDLAALKQLRTSLETWLRKEGEFAANCPEHLAPGGQAIYQGNRTVIKQIDKVIAKCASLGTAPMAPSPAACVLPPAGTAIRTRDGLCIRATNTNSQPRCKYSFTYSSSINGTGLKGDVVGAGQTDTHSCSARPGEMLTFERWHLVPANAQ